MTDQEIAAIEKRGANARAIGIAEIANPFYATNYMPAVTGEATEAWAQKAEAWHRGWVLEDAVRNGG